LSVQQENWLRNEPGRSSKCDVNKLSFCTQQHKYNWFKRLFSWLLSSFWPFPSEFRMCMLRCPARRSRFATVMHRFWRHRIEQQGQDRDKRRLHLAFAHCRRRTRESVHVSGLLCRGHDHCCSTSYTHRASDLIENRRKIVMRLSAILLYL
jgi:hypothetical protein